MISYNQGVGLKTKFLGLGLGTVRSWSWPWASGLECSGLGIKYKAIHYCDILNCSFILCRIKDYRSYYVYFNVLHTVLLFIKQLLSSPLLFYCIFFYRIAKMTQNWQINCGIFLTIYVRILGLGSVALALALTPLALLTSLATAYIICYLAKCDL